MKRLNSVKSVEDVESESESVVSQPSLVSRPTKPRIDLSELPSSVLDYDLKKMKSFKVKRKAHKFVNQGKMFVDELGVVLDQYEPGEHQFDLDLLVNVLDIAEGFFIHGNDSERVKQKRDAVKAVMLPYFRDDCDILDIMVTSVWKRVKKSTYIKRKWKKLKAFFF